MAESKVGADQMADQAIRNTARTAEENTERTEEFQTSQAESAKTDNRVSRKRAVASARTMVKIDRLLGRETDPRIVELSGLGENKS